VFVYLACALIASECPTRTKLRSSASSLGACLLRQCTLRECMSDRDRMLSIFSWCAWRSSALCLSCVLVCFACAFFKNAYLTRTECRPFFLFCVCRALFCTVLALHACSLCLRTLRECMSDKDDMPSICSLCVWSSFALCWPCVLVCFACSSSRMHV
jgi:hypothetical protein